MTESILSDVNLPILRIGEASRLARLSQSTVRQYEELGIVLPCRETSGLRLYSISDVQWLQAVRDYLRSNLLGPVGLAWLIRIANLSRLRRDELGEACGDETREAICWLACADKDGARNRCRLCPAYRNKSLVLDFEANFDVRLRKWASAS